MFMFAKRQYMGDDFFVVEREPSFWWTKTGQIVRWSVFLGLFTILMAYIIIGYFHAKSRIKKGKPLLGYHRWLVSRRNQPRYDPNYGNPSSYYQQYPPQGPLYGMQPMPPPMYDPNAPLPPTYQSPLGASKLENSQWQGQPTVRQENMDPSPGYAPPRGPPPTVSQSN